MLFNGRPFRPRPNFSQWHASLRDATGGLAANRPSREMAQSFDACTYSA